MATASPHNQEEILISDFSRCLPEDAVSWVEREETWLLKRYRAGNAEGIMLTAEPKLAVPEATYPLNLDGWYAIHVGIYQPDQRACSLEVRLTTDRVRRVVTGCAFLHEGYGWIMEGHWKDADLTGQSLHFFKPARERAYLAHVRLVPLTDEQVAEAKRDREQQGTKICGGVFDVHEILCSSPPYTQDTIRKNLEPFIGTDFKRICWGTTCSTYTYLYHTKVGEVFGHNKTDFISEGNRFCAEFLVTSLKEGWDPLRIAVDYCHENGLEIYADYRMDHSYSLGDYNDDFTGRFQKENQHLRCVNKDGSYNVHLSHAYPEVNEEKIAALREQAGYGVDGIYLDFTRFPPWILYEPPVVESFTKQYGEDPRKLPDNDLRWLKHKASYMTQFMRRLRAELGEVGRKTGRNIALIAQVDCQPAFVTSPSGRADTNLVNALDLETWIKEELIDVLAVSRERTYSNINLDYYLQMTRGKKCKLWGVLGQTDLTLFPEDYDWQDYFGGWPRKMIPQLDPRRLLRHANDLYNQGAEGILVWEMGGAPFLLPRWNELCRLGHKEELKQQFGSEIGRFDGYPEGIVEKKVQFLGT